jgi:hypothetical protein
VALVLVDTHNAIVNRTVGSELVSKSSKYGLAKPDREDGCHPCHSAIAKNVLATCNATAVALLAEAGLGQRLADSCAIAHEARGLLDRVAVRLSTILALMTDSAADSLEIHDALHNLRLPRRGLSWVFV